MTQGRRHRSSASPWRDQSGSARIAPRPTILPVLDADRRSRCRAVPAAADDAAGGRSRERSSTRMARPPSGARRSACWRARSPTLVHGAAAAGRRGGGHRDRVRRHRRAPSDAALESLVDEIPTARLARAPFETASRSSTSWSTPGSRRRRVRPGAFSSQSGATVGGVSARRGGHDRTRRILRFGRFLLVRKGKRQVHLVVAE